MQKESQAFFFVKQWLKLKQTTKFLFLKMMNDKFIGKEVVIITPAATYT